MRGRCGASAAAWLILLVAPAAAQEGPAADRPRARDVGVVIGRLPAGPENAITDVAGVRVGHRTLRLGDSIRTGVTAILPHGGDVFERRVRAAIAVGNGFGKLLGVTQVNELGELETPILLTGTLSVFRAADALLDTLLSQPAHRDVRSMNPVVGETNDGYLSDIRARPIGPEDVRAALREARTGPVGEGSVGAGTGTRALGWKGGIGTASRRWRIADREVTLGVLVQTNFGGSLRVAGVPVGARLAEGPGEEGRAGEPDAAAGDRAERDPAADDRAHRDGSVMIVLATDVPLAHRELERVASRTFLGIGRTGSYMSYGSGDYAIAFSTGEGEPVRDPRILSGLFEAAVEATEEAVINSLFKATSVTGHGGRSTPALPIARTLEILRAAGALSGGPP